MNTETNNTSVIEEVAVEAAEQQETVKTYTQEEVLALIQSESDKRVTAALKTQQKKYEKELSLSKLDGNEREKAEKDAEIAELRELVKQMNTERNKSELKTVLSARGLSAEFADIVVIGDDIETAQANIDKLDKLFKAAVKAEIEKRLAGNTPKGNGAAASGEMTRAEFLALPFAAQQQMLNANPELANKFLK